VAAAIDVAGQEAADTTADLVPPPLELGAFRDAGVVTDADLAIASGLARLAGCRPDDSAGLAVVLCLRALRSGSVCLDLASDPRVWQAEDTATAAQEAGGATTDHLPWPTPEDWLAAVTRSPLVAQGPSAHPDRPLRLVGTLLYLQRYWNDEMAIRRFIAGAGAAASPGAAPQGTPESALSLALEAACGTRTPIQQRLAVAAANSNRVTVITGGPGTGKTTTVARILAVAHQLDPGCRMLLAAPTGKAAARLTEAVAEHLLTLDPVLQAGLAAPTATTIHRMLGWRPGYRNRFRHDRYNPIAADLVIIDESSMVSLPQMARVLEAIPETARLVLVGDSDQLASVEAGAVLADLVAAPANLAVVELTHTFRYRGAIADLAGAIRSGDADEVVAILRRGDAQVIWHEPKPGDSDLGIATTSGLHADIISQDRAIGRAALAGDLATAVSALDSHRLLCAHREGRFGATHWSDLAQRWIGAARRPRAVAPGGWEIGQPLLVTANDYATDLFNGDTGVIVATDAGPRAAFGRGSTPLLISPGRLDNVVALRAMTVHRSQGSQFNTVSVLLPGPESPILTRELLYTAVTRAQQRVRLIATEDALRAAVARQVTRASGLRTGAPTP
jgi:exodeoxyribonuclease V alpha subunit